MNFKENILKLVINKLILISFFITYGLSQNLEFVNPDAVYQYTEEMEGSHSIYFIDSGPGSDDISNYSFEFLEEGSVWLNVVNSIFSDNDQYYIEFFGTPDDNDLVNTSFTLIVNKDNGFMPTSDTLEFQVYIEAVNDSPQILSQNPNPLFFLKNTDFQFIIDYFNYEDPDNIIEDISIVIYPGEYYSFSGDSVFVEMDYLGELLIDIALNDGEEENSFSDVFTTSVNIVAQPQIESLHNELVIVNEDEDFSFQIEFSDEDTEISSEFQTQLFGSAFNWLEVTGINLNENGNFIVDISGNPDDENLNDSNLEFTILDENGFSDFVQIEFQIIPVNDAPIIENQITKNVNEDNSFQIFISDLVIDDPLNENDTFDLILFEGENYTFDSLYTIQPDSNFYGDLNVNIQLTDGNSINYLSNTFQFLVNIVPVNDSPVFLPNEIDMLSFVEEDEGQFQVKFLDPDDTDPSNFTVNAIDNSSEWYMQYSISKEEDEYTINFTGTPDDVDVYQTVIEIEVVDGLLSDIATLNIQIESVQDGFPEIITALDATEHIDEDAIYNKIIEFIDIDNHPADSIDIEVNGSATNWLSYDNNLYFDTGNNTYQFTISGTPDDINFQEDFFIFKITDFDFGFVEDTIYFDILSVNDSPIVFNTGSDDLNIAFGSTNYSTKIAFQDIDNHDISDYQIEISNVLLNGDNADGLLEISELNYSNGEYYFDVFGAFNENFEIHVCEFDITITDEVYFMALNNISQYNSSNTVTETFSLEILPNSPPTPIISLSGTSGMPGSQITLNADSSYDINSDIDSYFWSVRPVIRVETSIDLNQNGEYDEHEPFYDINNNDTLDFYFEQEIYAQIENANEPSTILVVPETFEDSDIIVELTITDNKGASNTVEEVISSINPQLVLGGVSGNKGETVLMPINFNNLPNYAIYSLDLEFSWNLEELVNGEFECSSMTHYPPVIDSLISIEITELPETFQYQINEAEAGKLGVTIYSVNGDSLNDFISTESQFGELNISLTGLHSETDRIYVSRFDINELTYGNNSNFNVQNGEVVISGQKIGPTAGFLVYNANNDIIPDGSFIYSGSELEFEIITNCQGFDLPVVGCVENGQNLLGNGVNPQYSWDFDSDNNIDQSGPLNTNISNDFIYSISGSENVFKTAVLNVQTAYGCDSKQFLIEVEPLVPTISMAPGSPGLDSDGGNINLYINQVENLQSLDLTINFNSDSISVFEVESYINSDLVTLEGAHYSLFYNIILGQVLITFYSDSLANYTFSDLINEEGEQIASIKYYALESGNTDINITRFDINEVSFLDNIGDNSTLTIENNLDVIGSYDCNTNGIYDEGEECLEYNQYNECIEFVDLGDLDGAAIIDQCGICSGGLTDLIPNATQDCQGTCMPLPLLESLDIELAVDSVYLNLQDYSLICSEGNEGFNINSQECELYIGNESNHPSAGENGVDLCGICGGDNIELDGQFIGSNIDCNGFCSEETPYGSDQHGFCGCSDDADGIYPDIYGNCKNDTEPVAETGLCADIFDDVDMNGIWNLNGGDTIIHKIDTTTAEFSSWGFQYLNYDPIALNDDGSCSRGVVINEFFFSPVQATSIPDYIELLNMTPFDLDISSWSINGIEIDPSDYQSAPIMLAGQHFLISTGLPFYTLGGLDDENQQEVDLAFPGNCTESIGDCHNIPNSLALNINLGMNTGTIIIEDYTTMDFLTYSEEAYWPVGSSNIGYSVELIDPYKNRNLSSNWKSADNINRSEYMYTEDGEWEAGGGYNYGTPTEPNRAYISTHDLICNENFNFECNLTKYDCAEVFNGLAFKDLCQECSGGSTGLMPNIFDDELGICTGNAIDCACTCDSQASALAFIDDCGHCVGGNAGSFDSTGAIVVVPIDPETGTILPITTLECDGDAAYPDEDCTIWGMICNTATNLCHHEASAPEKGRMDKCGTCRLGPECNGLNDDICDMYFNIPEDYIDENNDYLYNEGEEFTDLNGDEIRNDGVDDCGTCTQEVQYTYGTDYNGDGIVSPCFDGYFDDYGNWVSNCPDWLSAYGIGCNVDCLGDVEEDGSDDVLAALDNCGECIECTTDDCSIEENWNSSCIYDFSATTDMNIPGVQLSWSPLYDYDYYNIFKTVLINNEVVDSLLLADSLNVTETILIDDEVEYPYSYCYYIIAFNELGEFSNPSSEQCASIDYYGRIEFGQFQINENFNSVRLNLDVSDEMALIYFQIADNVTVDALANELFDDNWYSTEHDGNNITITPENTNSNLSGFIQLGDIIFTRDETGLNDSFCISEADFHPLDDNFPDGFIVELPECEYFGCTNINAFNFDETATVNDGSCHLPHYELEIDSTDFFQNITFSSEIEELEIGDEIAIFDYSGILSTECAAESDTVLVGTSIFMGEDVTIKAIQGMPCPEPNLDSLLAEKGFLEENEIIVRIWRNSVQQEYIYSVSEQGHYFSEDNIIINQLNTRLYYQIEIEETGLSQSITFSELSGLQDGDHIGIFDYSGTVSTECPEQLGTILVGSGFYENDSLTIDAIRATPCVSIGNLNLPAGPGFIVGNEIIIKIWRGSEQIEYISQSHEEPYLFGTEEIFIDEILNNDILALPNNYQLYPVFPNPFNPIATIQYDIPEITNLSIEVFNVMGKRVELLFNGLQFPGMHQIKWDGSRYSSGLYLIRMTSKNVNFTEKVMLVK